MTDRPEALRRVPVPADKPRRRRDPQGKRALFSDEISPPSLGSVALHCEKCDSRSVVSVMQAARLAVPLLYIPRPGRADRIWMKCPACSERSWVRIRVKG
ncbi:MAG TPA: hypothetical protein PLT68_06445 [Actinomycetota bacterium]|nr:hypothetical protein [Actinomycetota bacterium]